MKRSSVRLSICPIYRLMEQHVAGLLLSALNHTCPINLSYNHNAVQVS